MQEVKACDTCVSQTGGMRGGKLWVRHALHTADSLDTKVTLVWDTAGQCPATCRHSNVNGATGRPAGKLLFMLSSAFFSAQSVDWRIQTVPADLTGDLTLSDVNKRCVARVAPVS